jgi:hypothetical protein
MSPPDCPTTIALTTRIEAVKGALAACNELMTEFISKRRAAKWDVINEGLMKAEAFVRRHSPAEKEAGK